MKKLLIAILALSSFLTLSGFTLSEDPAFFLDVTEAETYQKGIEYLADRGIVHGHPSGEYKPHDTVNRAEMVKIIAEGKAIRDGFSNTVFDPFADDTCFEDVPANEWYTKYVCYAKDQGWVVGFDNGRFYKPAQPVTLVEGMKISLEGMSIVYEETPSTWYKGPVIAASDINAIPLTAMDPNEDLGRDMMADMIARIISEGEGTLSTFLGPREEIVVDFHSLENNLNAVELATMDKGTFMFFDSVDNLALLSLQDCQFNYSITKTTPSFFEPFESKYEVSLFGATNWTGVLETHYIIPITTDPDILTFKNTLEEEFILEDRLRTLDQTGEVGQPGEMDLPAHCTIVAVQEQGNFAPFSPTDIAVGDTIVRMTVESATDFAGTGTPDNSSGIITFSGRQEVEGTYTYYDSSSPILEDRVCFVADFAVLPDPESIFHNPSQFCFSNLEDAQATFGPKGSTGTATVLIDEYIVAYAEGTGGVTNLAHLVKAL